MTDSSPSAAVIGVGGRAPPSPPRRPMRRESRLVSPRTARKTALAADGARVASPAERRAERFRPLCGPRAARSRKGCSSSSQGGFSTSSTSLKTTFPPTTFASIGAAGFGRAWSRARERADDRSAEGRSWCSWTGGYGRQSRSQRGKPWVRRRPVQPACGTHRRIDAGARRRGGFRPDEEPRGIRRSAQDAADPHRHGQGGQGGG